MKKSLNKIESLMLFLLPIVVFFSYYPVIRLGESASMHFELSLPIIWLAIFGVISLIKMPEITKKFGLLKSLIICAFPFYTTLAILWSENKIRGILTAGIMWLIVFSVINILNLKLDKAYLKKLLKVYLTSAVVAAVICIFQCFLDVFGVSRDVTLLCPGCTYKTLGFPHPNGFAIEPQFMGNLLIAPAIISLGLLYNAIKMNKNKRTMFGFGTLSFFIIMSLYICFSRGALYAFGIAGIVLGVILLVRDKSAQVFYLLIPTILGCVCGLLMQGVFSEISPTAENFTQGIQRSIHQVTLGKIDIREKTNNTESGEQSSFSGYIEESTDIRLNISDYAINAWKKQPISGVGLGGAGKAISKESGDWEKEIIQNEYINILTELGIIGVAILIIVNIYIIKNSKWPKSAVVIPVIIAYLITMGFFSGFPNILHIYLMTPVIYWLGQKRLV